VVEYFHYWYKNRDREDVSDMDIPVELCLELLMAADYLQLDSKNKPPNSTLLADHLLTPLTRKRTNLIRVYEETTFWRWGMISVYGHGRRLTRLRCNSPWIKKSR
jgi:hypothetical protein